MPELIITTTCKWEGLHAIATDIVKSSDLLLSVVGYPAARCRQYPRRLGNPRRLGIFPRIVQSFFLPIVPAVRRSRLALSWMDGNTIYSVICMYYYDNDTICSMVVWLLCEHGIKIRPYKEGK